MIAKALLSVGLLASPLLAAETGNPWGAYFDQSGNAAAFRGKNAGQKDPPAVKGAPAADDAQRILNGSRLKLIDSYTRRWFVAQRDFPRVRKDGQILEIAAWADPSSSKRLTKLFGSVRPDNASMLKGDRVYITSIIFGKEDILVEVNGGSPRAQHWYDHISAGNGDESRPMVKITDKAAANPEQRKIGLTIRLLFKDHDLENGSVPNLSGEQFEKLLSPYFAPLVDKVSTVQTTEVVIRPEFKQAYDAVQIVPGMNVQEVNAVLLKLFRRELGTRVDTVNPSEQQEFYDKQEKARGNLVKIVVCIFRIGEDSYWVHFRNDTGLVVLVQKFRGDEEVPYP